MNSSTVLMALMMVPTMPHGSTSTFQPLAWMSTCRTSVPVRHTKQQHDHAVSQRSATATPLTHSLGSNVGTDTMRAELITDTSSARILKLFLQGDGIKFVARRASPHATPQQQADHPPAHSHKQVDIIAEETRRKARGKRDVRADIAWQHRDAGRCILHTDSNSTRDRRPTARCAHAQHTKIRHQCDRKTGGGDARTTDDAQLNHNEPGSTTRSRTRLRRSASGWRREQEESRSRSCSGTTACRCPTDPTRWQGARPPACAARPTARCD
jgi:hypothetical protein